jgi:MFS family permease
MGPRSRPRILLHLFAAAFLADMALYLTMTGVPYRALALGAGPVILGFLPVARALPYSLSTVWAGGRSHRHGRLRLAPVTLTVAAAAAAGLAAAPGFAAIYGLLAVIGLMLAFFWPAVQATLADVAERESVTGNLGWFNIGWSTGKAVGFAAGGFLLAGFGFQALFLTAAFAFLAVAALVVNLSRTRAALPAAPAAPGSAPGPAVSPHTVHRFRLAAWTGNALAFGVGAVLNHHYPNWLTVHGRSEALFGSYLGLVFAAQTVTFAVLTRYSGWRYRAAPLLGSQVPLILVLLILPRLDAPAAILATAPLVGVGLGTAYFASIFYSVQDPSLRGRHAGVHESLLGVGSMILPVAGGWAAGATGHLVAPYLTAALAAVGGLLVQGWLLFGRRPVQ